MKTIIRILLVFSVCSTCNKEEVVDYRLKYLGTFNTSMFHEYGYMYNDSSGIKYITYRDTTFCFTFVSVDSGYSNRVKILFPRKHQFYINQIDLNTLYCDIDEWGNINIPITHIGHQRFYGSLKNDSLNFFSADGSLGGGFSYTVQGIKLK
jgi:hypothetical protein